MSALHLIRATAIFVVDCCQFGHTWMFGLKMGLMACANLVGVTTEKLCILLTVYDSINYMKQLLTFLNHTSAVPQLFLLLIAANLGQAGFLGENGAYDLCQP